MSIENNGGACRNIRRLAHVSLLVTDGERSRRFCSQIQPRSEKPLFDRNARRGRARIAPRLVVHGGQVRVDRARADDQPLGHLRVGEPLRHQLQLCW